MQSQLILASRSPRRIELLKLITTDFIVKPSHYDESLVNLSDPIALVKELGFQKAKSVFQENQNTIVIGCDTVVCLENEIFGIPKDKAQAKQTLEKLSNKTHQVITGVCVMKSHEIIQFESQTDVTFYPLNQQEIDDYLATDEPYDKAGAYGIQGKGALLVSCVCGDYFSVIGLPVAKLKRVLSKLI